MRVRLTAAAAVVSSMLTVCAVRDALAYDYTAPVPFYPVASFDPANGIVPFPNNLLFAGTTDLTLNIPVDDPGNFGDPKVAMNALDGFSTNAPWTFSFNMPISVASIDGNVHVYQVNLSGPGGAVTGIVRELAPVDEFIVELAGSDPTGETLVIAPTKPLEQMTSYMAVITDGLTDSFTGQRVRQSLPYLLAERPDPLCVDGHSTLPALSDDDACALEPLRQLTNAQEAAAVGAGIPAGSIINSWVMTTQSTTVELQALDSIVETSDPAQTTLVPTGKTLANLGLGLPGTADIYIGVIAIPYYLGAPTEDDPLAPLTDFWHAAPGAYIPDCAGFGLDPTSTNLTYCNPFPVPQSTQLIPVVMTVPNASSGHSKPAGGWPIVIYQHGITRNRLDLFAVAGTLAAQGFAGVAIDLPLHGVTDTTSPFYIGNTPFAALGAEERTFNLDVEANDSGAPGPDGAIDPSGTWFINLSSLLTSRDNLREGVADLFELAHSVQAMHISSGTDFDAGRISFVGQSLGSIVGTMFVSLDPNVNVATLSVPGGGIARLLDGSPTFGPRIRAGLAAAGIDAGTPLYDQFMVAAQTVVDSGDPLNFNIATAADKRLLMQEVVGNGGDIPPDQVIPNTVVGAPLSGTEPLIAAYGLAPITQTTQDPDGIRGATRYLQGEHGSLLDPSDFPLATVEMQGEMASMTASGGAAVVVSHPEILTAPAPPPAD